MEWYWISESGMILLVGLILENGSIRKWNRDVEFESGMRYCWTAWTWKTEEDMERYWSTMISDTGSYQGQIPQTEWSGERNSEQT